MKRRLRASIQIGSGSRGEQDYRFIFGPAKDESEIEKFRQHYFVKRMPQGEDGFAAAEQEYAALCRGRQGKY